MADHFFPKVQRPPKTFPTQNNEKSNLYRFLLSAFGFRGPAALRERPKWPNHLVDFVNKTCSSGHFSFSHTQEHLIKHEIIFFSRILQLTRIHLSLSRSKLRFYYRKLLSYETSFAKRVQDGKIVFRKGSDTLETKISVFERVYLRIPVALPNLLLSA